MAFSVVDTVWAIYSRVPEDTDSKGFRRVSDK